MAITQSIVAICEEHAEGRRLISVTLEIGDLSGVMPEAIEFCFDACTRETLLEGTKLIVERVSARGRCHGCDTEFAVGACYDPCPTCRGYGVELLSGEELRVKELEVE
jgi:hydrogenase nickel incorporation protein HypA/HybF